MSLEIKLIYFRRDMIKRLEIPKESVDMGFEFTSKNGLNRLTIKTLAIKVNEIIVVVNRLDRDKDTKKVVDKLDEIHETLHSIDFGVSNN